MQVRCAFLLVIYFKEVIAAQYQVSIQTRIRRHLHVLYIHNTRPSHHLPFLTLPFPSHRTSLSWHGVRIRLRSKCTERYALLIVVAVSDASSAIPHWANDWHSQCEQAFGCKACVSHDALRRRKVWGEGWEEGYVTFAAVVFEV